jgi:hypothetical protein
MRLIERGSNGGPWWLGLILPGIFVLCAILSLSLTWLRDRWHLPWR